MNQKNFKIIEIVINENDKVIPKERYMCPEERQKTIDNLMT